MAWTCHHGTRINCDAFECGLCVDENDAARRHDEQMEALNRIANNTSRESSLDSENRRLREELERLKRSR
jgi:hypothetical protein